MKSVMHTDEYTLLAQSYVYQATRSDASPHLSRHSLQKGGGGGRGGGATREGISA